MEEESLFKLLYMYMSYKMKTILLLCIYLVIFIIVFSLYSVVIELEPVIYALILSIFLTIIITVKDFLRFYKKHRDLCHFKLYVGTTIQGLPVSNNLIEHDYHDLLYRLFDFKNNLALQADLKETDMIDYYTLWAHQIKTPIAAMKLLLQSESDEPNSELMMQLRTVEQYVEMVLGYLRIESPSSDICIKKHDVAKLVKQAVRKYSSFFIKKNIKLEIIERECIALTDEKWLLFVIEQILFNALKYTHKGKITISIEPQQKLVIKDTGIGIAEEDLPRIFEKGFTGYNGRMDKKATGIGLYLSMKILNKLSHKVEIKSEVGVGTAVILTLSSKEKLMD